MARTLASMTFAIGLANQISALIRRFGNHGLCLTGMSSRGVIVVECSVKEILAETINELAMQKTSIYGDTKVLYYQF